MRAPDVVGAWRICGFERRRRRGRRECYLRVSTDIEYYSKLLIAGTEAAGRIQQSKIQAPELSHKRQPKYPATFKSYCGQKV